MRKPKQFVTVRVAGVDTSLPVTERPGYVKADMHGLAGWTSVWASSANHLVGRIQYARELGARIDQLRRVGSR